MTKCRHDWRPAWSIAAWRWVIECSRCGDVAATEPK